MKEQRNAKKSGIKTSRKKKRGRSTSEWQKSTKKHKERKQKDTSTIPATICSQSAVNIPMENFSISDSLGDKSRKRKRNVVIPSLDEEIPIDKNSHLLPSTRKVTRSMMKKKCQNVQENITLVVIEDSSPNRELDPQLDLYWTEEAEKVYEQYSPLYKSHVHDPIKCSFKEPIIPG